MHLRVGNNTGRHLAARLKMRSQRNLREDELQDKDLVEMSKSQCCERKYSKQY